MIQSLFQQAKKVSPSLLFIEDIDALARLEKQDGYEGLLRHFLIELDGLDKHSRMVVLASRLEEVDPSLMKIGRFDQRVIVGDSFTIQVSFCPACKREVLADWRHCVYCGASLAKVCSQCGSPRPEIEGARFCLVCGHRIQG